MSVKQGGKTIAGATQYHPDLFDFKWADHILDDAQWLMANTFSWQYGSMYQTTYAHLAADIVGKTLQSETVAGITVQFYLADDGHKICPDSEEDKVLSIYNKTGNAWYYIIDSTNQRFKLPRKHSQQIVRSVKNTDGSWYRLYADGWVEQGGIIQTNTNPRTIIFSIEMIDTNYQVLGNVQNGSDNGATFTMQPRTRATTSVEVYCTYSASHGSGGAGENFYWQVSGQSAIDMSSFQGGEKYLYFYVGAFTQTAIENTAGLNTELFNQKADLNLSNTTSNIDFVVESQEPTAANGYTWYRKYKSGWVEQGGWFLGTASGVAKTITLPIEMIDTNYSGYGIVSCNNAGDSGNANSFRTTFIPTSTTQITLSQTNGWRTIWRVSGIAA